MKMIRSFLPVGQGAFYCEKFKLNPDDNNFINVVYDCGSLNNPKRVEKQIKANFHEGETIHAVFISHLHNDHINGLEFLLKYCNVRKIFLPLTTKKEKTILTLYELSVGISFNNFTTKFIINPRRTIEETTPYKEIPIIREIEPERAENGLQELENRKINSHIKNVAHEIFGVPKNSYNDWLYIPFNFSYEERTNRLFNKLKILLNNSLYDLAELGELWRISDKQTKNTVKNAYAEIKGSHNPNSMTLYSGTKKHWGHQFIWDKCYYKCRVEKSYHNIGCLYTGDYDASKKDNFYKLKESYADYWENIGCIQIPHHGSIYSYNTGFSELNSFFVISAGQNNMFSHPHNFVINDLLLNEHYPLIVTEKIDSAIYFIIKIY